MSQSFSTVAFGSSDSGWSTDKIAIGLRDCDLNGSRVFGVAQGKRGTRQDYDCRAAQLAETVEGGFNIYPTDAELDWIMNRAFGTNAGTPWVPGETLPAFFMWLKKGGVQTFMYHNLRVNRFVISGAETQFLNCRVDCIGEKETEVTDLTPGVTVVDCDTVFPFGTIVLTIGGTAYKIKSFEFSVDNMIASGQMENNLTRQIFESEGLAVGLNVNCAYRSDTKALYRQAITGAAASLLFTNGTNNYTITLPNLKIPNAGPTVPENGEVTMGLQMQAFRTTANPIFTITKA